MDRIGSRELGLGRGQETVPPVSPKCRRAYCSRGSSLSHSIKIRFPSLREAGRGCLLTLTQIYDLDPMISVCERKSMIHHVGDVTALVGFEDYYIRLETTAASAGYNTKNRPLFRP